jgi:thymidylate synthase (FAD)
MRAVHAPVFRTRDGVAYLREPGVVLLSRPEVDLSAVRPFLEAFDVDFDDYLDDPVELPPGERLAKFAGQLCYMSFGEKRTMNADAQRYFDNIVASGHGSVLQHVNLTFLIYGADRSFTHELVRHGTGTGFSQQSQRYVDGKVLRFVERPEFAADEQLHTAFEDRIEQAAAEYDAIAERLRQNMLADPAFAALPRTDQRKRVNQAARACLPNETEACIVVTANVRAWRHIIEQRASVHADVPIRKVASKVFEILRAEAPMLLNDYVVDGETVSTPYRKV